MITTKAQIARALATEPEYLNILALAEYQTAPNGQSHKVLNLVLVREKFIGGPSRFVLFTMDTHGDRVGEIVSKSGDSSVESSMRRLFRQEWEKIQP